MLMLIYAYGAQKPISHEQNELKITKNGLLKG